MSDNSKERDDVDEEKPLEPDSVKFNPGDIPDAKKMRIRANADEEEENSNEGN